MSDPAEVYAQAMFDKIHDDRANPPQQPMRQAAPDRPTPAQIRMMQQRRQRFEEMRRERMRQKAVERIKAQVVYSPVLTSPQKSGYEPIPQGLGVMPDRKLGVPVGIDARQLSPGDREVFAEMLAMNTAGR